MATKSLRIAWIGGGPGSWETGGTAGVATELLYGLTRLGHEIDCFLPAAEREVPARLRDIEKLSFIWGTSEWRWGTWYSRIPVLAFASGLMARGISSLRLRRRVLAAHAQQPYDVVFQFSNIEALTLPASTQLAAPLIMRPDTHIAGELRHVLAERRLAYRCQPLYTFALVTSIMTVRALMQRVRIRRADLLICISSVFRDHLIHDYGFPAASTVVVPNPVRLERFAELDRKIAAAPTVLVLGRIAARKGIEDAVALAEMLRERDVEVRLRFVGGPSLWSDYRKLLEALPQNAEYAGPVPAAGVPAELARSDILLQPSKYEPFGLNVAEALAAGLPVVATSEVGAIENVDRSVLAVVTPGDIDGMASAIADMIKKLESAPAQIRKLARAEAQRLFAPDVVCQMLSKALQSAVDRSADRDAVNVPTPPRRTPAASPDLT